MSFLTSKSITEQKKHPKKMCRSKENIKIL